MKATTLSHPNETESGSRDHFRDTQLRAFVSQMKTFLCQTYSLMIQTQGCHWNYTGINFPGMHLLFEKQYEYLFKEIDVLAERLRAMNVYAPASLAEIYEVASKRDLSEYDSSLNDQLDRLLISHKVMQKDLDELIERAESCNDLVTQDILVQQKAFHDNALWMLNVSK